MFFLNFCCCREQSEQKPKPKINVVPVDTAIEEKRNSIKIDRYDGELFEGRPNGNGKMMYANGDYYIGEWVLGVKEGRGFEIIQETGIKYQGQFHNGLPHGTGKLIFPNNSIYVGEFYKGLKHEKGVFQNAIQNKRYEEVYQYGSLKERIEINIYKMSEEKFMTFEKERFNSQEMQTFVKNNPQIKKLNLQKLLTLYGLLKIFSFETRHPKQWKIGDFSNFLEKINLTKYKQIFFDNRVKGRDLLNLTPSQLRKDLGMKVGDRKRLMNYINYLNQIHGGETKNNQKVQKEVKRDRLISLISSKRRISNDKKNFPYQSIQEQNEQSSSGSQSPKRNNNKNNHNFQETFPKKKDYNHETDFISAQDLMRLKVQQNPKEISKKAVSERSSNSIASVVKQQSLNGKDIDEIVIATEEEKKDSTQSSWSSNFAQPELQRRKTNVGQVQQTEIQRILQFIKSNSGLDLIRQKDMELLEEIEEGGYGKVYKAKYVGSLIAVKDYMKAGKKGNCEDFMKEVQVISGLKHPNIVLSMGMCITASRYRLITEFMENGSLFDQLHRKKRHFTQNQRLEMLDDIVKGMVYLHNMKKILHRDLKSSNVLIDENWKVKLCDFGLSAYRSSKRKQKNRVGTFAWMAPEVIMGDDIDFPADVYSFGVIIWEMLVQKIPYEGCSEQQIIGIVGYDQSHGLEKPEADPFFISIMNKCLLKNPRERPTFLEIQEELNTKFEDKEKRQEIDF